MTLTNFINHSPPPPERYKVSKNTLNVTFIEYLLVYGGNYFQTAFSCFFFNVLFIYVGLKECNYETEGERVQKSKYFCLLSKDYSA